MSDTSSGGPVPFPPAPPTAPGMIPATRSSWPTVFGIISIILGAAGALLGCWTVVATVFLPDMMDFLTGLMPAPQAGGVDMSVTYDAVAQYAPWTIAVHSVNLGLAVMLLVAGVGLTQRRAYAPRWSTTWAGLRIMMLVPLTWLDYLTGQAQFAAMASAPGGTGMPPGLAGLQDTMLVLGLAAGVLWRLWYPILVLVWMNRQRIKAETAGWA